MPDDTPAHVVTAHSVSPAGHSQFRVCDEHGRWLTVTVRRRAALDGHAANVIARALALHPDVKRSYP